MQAPSMAALVARIAGREPVERLEAVASLRRQLEALEADYVADAVRLGASWSRIGGALGITRQAAHKKHAKQAGRQIPEDVLRGQDREVLVTSEAWRAVRLAREEARMLRADGIGTEHLLLGLIRADEGTAGELLRRFGVTLPRARSVIEPTVEISLEEARAALASPGADPAGGAQGAGPDEPAASSPDVSPLARSVLEESLRAALTRDDGYLSGEHLLLALLHDESGGAPRTLQRLGVPADAIEQELVQALQRI
jgi:hypothetical protein